MKARTKFFDLAQQLNAPIRDKIHDYIDDAEVRAALIKRIYLAKVKAVNTTHEEGVVILQNILEEVNDELSKHAVRGLPCMTLY